jgi:hypothetical protein
MGGANQGKDEPFTALPLLVFSPSTTPLPRKVGAAAVFPIAIPMAIPMAIELAGCDSEACDLYLAWL